MLKSVSPVCAGWRAAATRRRCWGLRRMYAPQLSVEELCRIGERVGSDDPTVFFGGTALAEGAARFFDAPCADTGMLGCTVQAGFFPFPPELFGCVDAKKLTSHRIPPGMCESLGGAT